MRGITWLPLVLPSQLQSFEAYANATLGAQWAFATNAQMGYNNATDFAAGIATVTRNVQGGVFAGSASVHRPVNASALYYFPVTQVAPLHTNEAVVMFDLNSEPTRARAIAAVMATGQPATTDWLYLVQDASTSRIATLALTPVAVGGAIVGLTSTVFNWDTLILQSLPSFLSGIDTVLSSSLSNRTFTMRIVAGAVIGIGEGDRHEANALVNSYASPISVSLGAEWTLTLYPTSALISSYHTTGPRDRCIAVLVVVLVCLGMFAFEDYLVTNRSMLLLRLVTATSRIVDDVFPKSVKARMMSQALSADGGGGGPSDHHAAPADAHTLSPATLRVLSVIQKLVGMEASERAASQKTGAQLALTSGLGPIADTFPAVTVLFADIAGFTEWAAARPPEVVFAFLGTLWCTFDELCAVRGIFKVETVGDQYSALPSARRVPQLIDSAPFSVRLRPSRAHRGACRTHGGFRAGHGGGDAQGLRRQRGRGPVHARGAAQRHLSGRGVDGRARPVSVVWGHGEHRQPDGEHRRGGAGAGERDHGAAAAAQRPV